MPAKAGRLATVYSYSTRRLRGKTFAIFVDFA